jgi:RNA polymerase sigma-70 factor (ECF subfamily)
VSHLGGLAALSRKDHPVVIARVLVLRSALAVALPGQDVHTPEIGPVHADEALVLRARNGDRWAEEALYRRHVRNVARIAMRLLGRRHEAEDAVQDAFVIAFADLDSLADPSAFGGWLVRILIHQAHRRFRRRALLRLLGLDRGEDDVTLEQQMDPGAGPDVQLALREIDRLLATFPARERIAWVLRYVEGCQIDEVAVACECSPATAKRAIARAHARIREHVRFAGDDDE